MRVIIHIFINAIFIMLQRLPHIYFIRSMWKKSRLKNVCHQIMNSGRFACQLAIENPPTTLHCNYGRIEIKKEKSTTAYNQQQWTSTTHNSMLQALAKRRNQKCMKAQTRIYILYCVCVCVYQIGLNKFAIWWRWSRVSVKYLNKIMSTMELSVW